MNWTVGYSAGVPRMTEMVVCIWKHSRPWINKMWHIHTKERLPRCPLQYSCLENSMYRGAWKATVMKLPRAGHDWSDLVCTHIHTREYHSAFRKKSWHMCHTQWMNIEPIMLNEISQSQNITWSHSYKENWEPKNWCFWTVVLEKTLESPLDCEEIQPVHPKGDQSWVFIGRTDVEAETPILWPPDAESWLIGKDPDAGKNWGQEERDDRGWDGWMASPTRWTWVWVSSGS